MGTSIARLSVILLVATASACGPDASDGDSDSDAGPNSPLADSIRFPEGTTCGAALEVSGALDLRIVPSDSSTACATSVSFESGLDVGFLFVDSGLSRADLEVEDVAESEIGEDFSARLRIVHEDGREWNGEGCDAYIAEHEYIAPAELGWKSYRVSGGIECTSMSSADADHPLDLRSFVFVASIHWG